MNQLAGMLLVLGGIYGILATKNDWAIKISPGRTKLGRYIMDEYFSENGARTINYVFNVWLMGFGVVVLLGIIDFTAST